VPRSEAFSLCGVPQFLVTSKLTDDEAQANPNVSFLGSVVGIAKQEAAPAPLPGTGPAAGHSRSNASTSPTIACSMSPHPASVRRSILARALTAHIHGW